MARARVSVICSAVAFILSFKIARVVFNIHFSRKSIQTGKSTLLPKARASVGPNALDQSAKLTEDLAKRLLFYIGWLTVAFLARAAVFLVLAVGYGVGESPGCTGDCDACQSTAYLVMTTMEKQVD